jgi:hypothetical protein
MHAGFSKGKLSLEYTDMVTPMAVLSFHPELQTQLDEITKQGWSYLFIESRAKSVCELNIDETYRLLADGTGYYIQLFVGDQPPGITGMPEVTEFRINICTKSFPRAATIDLPKGMVTYIHEALWEWQEDWRNDPVRLEQAKEVYEVAKWLVNVKKMKLHEELKVERFTELAKLFEVPKEEEPVK